MSDWNNNRRFLTRESFASFDRVFLEARGLRYQVANLTSFGATLRGPRSDTWKTGSEISNAIIYFGSRRVAQIPTLIVLSDRGTVEFGVMFAGSQGNSSLARQKARPAFMEHIRPLAECVDPVSFDRDLSFRVVDLSAEGACLHTSARNRLIFPGLLLDLRITAKASSTPQIQSEVVHVSRSEDRNTIIVGVRFLNISDSAKQSLGPLLLSFADTGKDNRMDLVKMAGFDIKNVKKYATFRLAQSTEDYRGVLRLRAEAYRRAGKVADNATAGEMADIFDLRSHIIVAEFQGEIVGSVRLTSCPNAADRFELDQSVVIPNHLVRKDTIEISRLCVSTTLENSNLVLGLIERCAEICLKLGIKHVITSSVEDMIPFYKKLAFAPVGKSFALKTLEGVPHRLLIMDTKSISHLKSYNPIAWYFTFRSIVSFLHQSGHVTRSRLLGLKTLIGQIGFQIRRLFGRLR